MIKYDETTYLNMQKNWYETHAKMSIYTNGVAVRDQIVGNFQQQEEFPYEDWLFKYYTPDPSHICYEYGCGPGRQIRRLLPFFGRVDGVDISLANIQNAATYIGKPYNGILVMNDGTDIPLVDKYNFCYSIICLQHIPIYSVRRKILDNMYASLKEGGNICIQLAFGESINGTPTFGYKEDYYDAPLTNGRYDCRVDSISEVSLDFMDIGFQTVWTMQSETVEDHHPEWIWIYGRK